MFFFFLTGWLNHSSNWRKKKKKIRMSASLVRIQLHWKNYSDAHSAWHSIQCVHGKYSKWKKKKTRQIWVWICLLCSNNCTQYLFCFSIHLIHSDLSFSFINRNGNVCVCFTFLITEFSLWIQFVWFANFSSE